MRSRYDTVLFDWDGTLAQTLGTWLKAIRSGYSDFGLEPPSDSNIAKNFGNWQAPLSFGLSESELSQFNEIVTERAVLELRHVELYPGAANALKRIAQMPVRRALLTSSTGPIVKSGLENHGLDEYFGTVVAAEDVAHHKPDPECIEVALGKMGITHAEAGRIVILGDSDKDLGVANNAEIDCLLFLPEENKVFYDFDQLKTLNPADTFKDWAQVDNLLIGSP